MIIENDPQSMASRLRTRLASSGTQISHSQALELVAAQLGYLDWNTCAAATHSVPAPVTIPILRTFPGDQARRFYVEFLGFSVDWEHRFEEGMPLYQQLSLGGCVLHLSEHHGDATPGSAVRIEIPDVVSLQRRLVESPIYPLRIGLDSEPWGDDLTIPDPFGNRITFHTPRAGADTSHRDHP
jgi:catechol 2,3-dioxygenase-like lactoylglutathione lyase family enzyme